MLHGVLIHSDTWQARHVGLLQSIDVVTLQDPPLPGYEPVTVRFLEPDVPHPIAEQSPNVTGELLFVIQSLDVQAGRQVSSIVFVQEKPFG